MSKVPVAEYVCCDCKVSFVGSDVIVKGSVGKTCPNKHFNTIHKLKSGARVRSQGITDSQAVLVQNNVEAQKTTEAERKFLNSLGPKKLPLKSYGIVGRVQELELALQLMLDTYDKYSHTVAPSHTLSSLFEGAFASNAELAKRILYKNIG